MQHRFEATAHPRPRGASATKIAALAFALVLGGCAAPRVAAPEDDAALAMIVAAKGVQIYECRAAASGGYAWAFVAPEATLFDARGVRAGRHGAGPYWEATDGSRIVGEVVQRIDAPRRDDIPWLVLRTTSVEREGALAGVTTIRRVNTAGGVAPSSGCDASTAGSTTRVAYTADYEFYRARPRG